MTNEAKDTRQRFGVKLCHLLCWFMLTAVSLLESATIQIKGNDELFSMELNACLS